MRLFLPIKENGSIYVPVLSKCTYYLQTYEKEGLKNYNPQSGQITRTNVYSSVALSEGGSEHINYTGSPPQGRATDGDTEQQELDGDNADVQEQNEQPPEEIALRELYSYFSGAQQPYLSL